MSSIRATVYLLGERTCGICGVLVHLNEISSMRSRQAKMQVKYINGTQKKNLDIVQ